MSDLDLPRLRGLLLAANLPLPLRPGRLLDTKTTRRWSQTDRDRVAAKERCEVYVNFHESDQGKSRVRIGTMVNASVADLIVEAVNTLPQLLARLEAAEAKATALQFAIDAGGWDISPCMECGTPVVCLPDGMPMCEKCGERATCKTCDGEGRVREPEPGAAWCVTDCPACDGSGKEPQ